VAQAFCGACTRGWNARTATRWLNLPGKPPSRRYCATAPISPKTPGRPSARPIGRTDHASRCAHLTVATVGQPRRTRAPHPTGLKFTAPQPPPGLRSQHSLLHRSATNPGEGENRGRCATRPIHRDPPDLGIALAFYSGGNFAASGAGSRRSPTPVGPASRSLSTPPRGAWRPVT
jgi:hypothetical protein